LVSTAGFGAIASPVLVVPQNKKPDSSSDESGDFPAIYRSLSSASANPPLILRIVLALPAQITGMDAHGHNDYEKVMEKLRVCATRSSLVADFAGPSSFLLPAPATDTSK
jgi:hypothetical protein